MATTATLFTADRIRVLDCLQLTNAHTEAQAEIIALLTPEVTAWLPPHWQQVRSGDSLQKLIENTNEEGACYAICPVDSLHPLGLLILSKCDSTGSIHIGYLFAQSCWGKGYASELLGALVHWAEAKSECKRLVGGVAPQNLASIRVLEKAGFTLDGSAENTGQLFYSRTS